ncbi:MAG: heparinase II/III family protein, partial [Spirochaetaceae bacterium]|nr:heparinase II/III family protein [Spirochaetaceae bacterium]
MEIAAPVLDARHPGFRDKIVRELFEPAIAILIPQLRKIHNIACWLDAAIGLVGIAAGRDDLVSLALDEPGYGLQAQLRAGLTEDSLWFEGSVHYHYFALEAALSLLLAASRKGIRRPRAEYAVLNALDAGYRMAFSSGRFPAPNDGWPDVGLKTYAHVYDLAAAFFGPGSPADGLRAAIDDATGERVEVPLTPPWYYEDRISLERLLFAPAPASVKDPAPPRQPYVLRGSCMAMLRRPGLEVYVKYGHNGPSHAHPDKMNLEVALGGGLLTRDLSNAGYGARLCDAWHRSSPAHNTVVIDGQDHVSTERGRMLWFGADRLSVRAVDVYPGVSFTRSITLTWSGFADVFDVKAATPRVMDWFFHVDGELAEIPEGLMKDGDLGYGGAYSLLEGMRQLSPREVLELKFSVAGRIAVLRADTRGIAAFVGRSLDNPVDGRRTVVVLRARARRVRFDTEWTV